MSDNITHITDSSFEQEVLQSDVPVPPKFGIRGIPTLMIFKGGDVQSTKVGALSKSQLTAFIDQSI